MKRLISYYRMPGDQEEQIARIVKAAGLDGVENLIYGNAAAAVPFTHVTKGVHLRYWPYWMDFYRGNQEGLRRIFASPEEIRRCYGGLTADAWIDRIRANIRAALAEEPEYLVWHVQESTPEEAWTWTFHYTDEEVLAASAEVYHACADLIPDGVRVLFENIFWPGLFHMEPHKVEYFFRAVDDEAHTGIMFDTGHFMNTNADLQSEEDGARYILSMVRRLGSLSSLIRGVHLSCSLSGAYQRSFSHVYQQGCTMEKLLRHISQIDQHRPFETGAAREILEAIRPSYVVNELFGATFQEAAAKAAAQMKAAGLSGESASRLW